MQKNRSRGQKPCWHTPLSVMQASPAGQGSRYTHTIAVSNSRLIRFDARSVTFHVKDYRRKGAGHHTTMTLATHEFIRRFLIHVLPKGQHRIRHYGFFGNGNRATNIARIRLLLGANRSDKDRTDEDSSSDTIELPRVLTLPCPCCGAQLVIIDTVAPSRHPRAPPTARAAVRQPRQRSKIVTSAARSTACEPIVMRRSRYQRRKSG